MAVWNSLTKSWTETNVQETSFDAFAELKKGKLSARRQEVLNGFEQLKTATNLEVSDLLKIPINSVTPRTNELVITIQYCLAYEHKI